jgi:hypothetical protein
LPWLVAAFIASMGVTAAIARPPLADLIPIAAGEASLARG